MLVALLAGFLVGLVLAAPIGPLGALAAYQASHKRVRAAWQLATGACMADSLLALVATWSTELPIQGRWLDGGLCVVMAFLAVHLVRTAHERALPFKEKASLWVGLVATFLHPINLLTFGLAFSWLHSEGLVINGWLTKPWLVAGVFAGAMVVWGIVIEVAGHLGKAVDMARFQVRFKYVLAALCALTALGALASFLQIV